MLNMNKFYRLYQIYDIDSKTTYYPSIVEHQKLLKQENC